MINEEMRIVGFRDFYKRSRKIKSYYEKLSVEGKWTYKYYLYSHRFLTESVLDIMWEYLNESKNSEYYVSRKKLGEYYLKVKK